MSNGGTPSHLVTSSPPPKARSSTPPRLTAWSLAALALALVCCSHTPPSPSLQRLLPGLGGAHPIVLSGEMRPAVRLVPGQAATVEIQAPPNARLDFAFGLTSEAPADGYADLALAADGREVFRRRYPLKRREHWWAESVELPASPSLRLSFRGEYAPPGGGLGTAAPPAAAWMVLGSPCVRGPGARPPRVLVWISQDALRADHLGFYGYPRPTSPRLDEWARKAVVFDRSMASAPWTLPSLASQFTSRHPSFHGATRHTLAVAGTSVSMFEVLAREGFTVLGVAATPFLTASHGLSRGFDALATTEGSADEVNRLAARLLREWRSGDLALFVHYLEPHTPYHPPAEFARLFARPYQGRFRGGALEDLPDTPDDVAHAQDLYDGEIRHADTRIAELWEELAGRGLLENAVMAYSADHGEEFFEHGSWRHGGTLYEEVLRVPLVLRVPGVAARRVEAPVSLVDLAPTLLEALGLERPASFQGRSLLPVARGANPTPGPLWAETELCADRRHRVAVRVGTRKYLATLAEENGGGERVVAEEFYDLSAGRDDPIEHPSPAESGELKGLMLSFIASAQTARAARHSIELEPAARARLRALGYVN